MFRYVTFRSVPFEWFISVHSYITYMLCKSTAGSNSLILHYPTWCVSWYFAKRSSVPLFSSWCSRRWQSKGRADWMVRVFLSTRIRQPTSTWFRCCCCFLFAVFLFHETVAAFKKYRNRRRLSFSCRFLAILVSPLEWRLRLLATSRKGKKTIRRDSWKESIN